MVTEKIFEAALGISSPWYIAGMVFETDLRKLTIRVDFEVGSRFAVPGQRGEHPVHDTVTKSYRHLNFFQHECMLTAGPACEAAGREGGAGHSALGRQALRLHAAV